MRVPFKSICPVETGSHRTSTVSNFASTTRLVSAVCEILSAVDVSWQIRILLVDFSAIPKKVLLGKLLHNLDCTSVCSFAV